MFTPKNYNTNGGDETVIGGTLTVKPEAKVNGFNATKARAGLVKQAVKVAEAKGDTVTGAEFKALLDALKAAGIMAKA